MNKLSIEFSEILDENLHYKIYNNQEEIGSFLLSFELDSIYFDDFTIFRGFRNCKYGQRFMELLLEFCKSFSYKKIYLFVDFDNERAQHIYRKAGFEFLNDILDFCYKMEYSYDKN